MAKRIINHRQEINLTDKEAKEYILEKVFTGVGSALRIENFPKCAITAGIEGSLEKLVNELIKEGKLRVEQEWVHGGFGGCWIWVIRRIT